ncbi:MAG: hypothetical protein KGM46_09960 [Pseudomonadota bacterium]|jgi:hypothetical protein|nr:hypothetical protein [Xanthomonadaceae bacterium]MDE2248098.1 hypothetical protein [Xanthomonadaceae bacterium]MDE3211056.1 hypothetical protein [Pseudomonadota bacterium]
MPIRPRHLLLSLLLTLIALPALAQQDGGLRQRMSKSEFTAAGLDKLSSQQLANLDAWLSHHPKVTTRVVNASGKPVFYTEGQKRSKFKAHIAGHFDGWSGHGEYTLDNGQAWKQLGEETPACMTSTHPAVVVKPSIMDSWLMYVNGCNDSVHVTRTR